MNNNEERWVQDPDFPQYEKNLDTGKIRLVGEGPKEPQQRQPLVPPANVYFNRLYKSYAYTAIGITAVIGVIVIAIILFVILGILFL